MRLFTRKKSRESLNLQPRDSGTVHDRGSQEDFVLLEEERISRELVDEVRGADKTIEESLSSPSMPESRRSFPTSQGSIPQQDGGYSPPPLVDDVDGSNGDVFSQIDEMEDDKKVEEVNEDTRVENYSEQGGTLSRVSSATGGTPSLIERGPMDSMDYSTNGGTVESLASATYANDFVMVQDSALSSHVTHWKYNAEEGPLALRVAAMLAAIGVMATTVTDFFLEDGMLAVPDIIISVIVFMLGVIICFLDGRFFFLNPKGFRGQVRAMLTKNVALFRHVWGRGLLYIFTAVLHVSHMTLMMFISGGYMGLVGFAAIIVGCCASNKLARLKQSMDDDRFLRDEFDSYDYDKDGFMDISDFAHFLASIGLEFDDTYAVRTFRAIDAEGQRRISFAQFRRWWMDSNLTLDFAKARQGQKSHGREFAPV